MSTSRKILVVSGIYPPDIGGPATYVPQICEQLVRDGYTVSVVSLEDETTNGRKNEPWKRTFISRKHNKIFRVLLTIATLLKESAGCSAVFANGLYEEVGVLKLFRPKIHFIAKIVGDPIWERDRNRSKISVQIEEFNKRPLNFRNLIERRILTWSLNRFDVVTCPSLQLKELIGCWDVKKEIYVIHNGIRCKEVAARTIKYDVVSVTRLVPWKNLDKVIIACAKTGMRLALCGEGPEMANLKIIAETSGADVKFLGQLDSKNTADVIDESNIFALLSDYEGLSFALLEAMMAGKRILVSECRGNTDVISDDYTGKIVDPDDERAVQSALKELAENSASTQALEKNAHDTAKMNYCAEKQIGKMINLIVESYEE